MSDASASASSTSPSSAPEIPPVPAGHSQLYLKNLSFSTTEETLGAYVEKTVGVKPQNVTIITTKRPGKFQGRSRGFGFVTVVEAQAANVIAKLNNVDFEGRVVAVVEAKPRDPSQPRPPRQPRQPRQPKSDSKNEASSSSSSSSSSSAPSEKKPKPERKTFENATQLYVNNLAFATTADELKALFQSKTGVAPLDVEIVTRKYGKFQDQSRGFGFVFVPNSALEKALALNNTQLNEREIGVQPAKPPSDDDTPRPRRQRKPRNNTDNNNNENGGHDDGSSNNEAPDNRRRRRGRGGRRGGGGGDDSQQHDQNDQQQSSSAASSEGGRGRGRGARRGGGGGRGGKPRGGAAASTESA